MLIIPEYLLDCTELVRFIRDVMEDSELVYLYEELFELWWRYVAEKEYIENSVDQANIVRHMLEEAIKRRITFVFYVDETPSDKVVEALNNAG